MRVIDFTNLRTGHLNTMGMLITWHNGDTESFDSANHKYNLDIKEYDNG